MLSQPIYPHNHLKSITSNNTKFVSNSLPSTNTGQDEKNMSVSNSSLSGVTIDKGNNILDGCHSILEAKTGETNECDAPGSNSTLASREHTERLPATTVLDAWVSYRVKVKTRA